MSQIHASPYIAPPLGKVTWIKSGLGLHKARIWGELCSKQWGLWYQRVAESISSPHLPWLHGATFFSNACESNLGFLDFPLPPVFWPLLSLYNPLLWWPSLSALLAFCSYSWQRPLFLTQASQLGTRASPPHQGNSTKQNCFQEPRVTVVVF